MSGDKNPALPNISGRIWVLGDNIDTDLIVPSRVLTDSDPAELLSATLENLIPEFALNVKEGDILVAGRNFGCGSSREEAVFVLKELGVAAIVAKSFARIFFRNCINLGLPAIEPQRPNFKVTDIGDQGDIIEINFQTGQISNPKQKTRALNFEPFPPFLAEILKAGGILATLQKDLNLNSHT